MEPNLRVGRLESVDGSVVPAIEAPTMAAHDITAGATVAPAPIAFADFYRTHGREIGLALEMTLGDRELAEDALNEAMARALQRWKQVARFDNPAGWVYRVAINWATSWLRRRRRERDRPGPVGPATAELAPVELELRTAIDGLSVDHRAVVVCRYFLDWTVEQTATSLDIPNGTVKSRLARALDHIRRDLEGQT